MPGATSETVGDWKCAGDGERHHDIFHQSLASSEGERRWRRSAHDERSHAARVCPIYPGEQVPSSDPRYPTLVRGINLRWVGKPAYVALCGDTTQVVQAVQRALDNDRRIKMRSGGHCYKDFVSGNDGGVIIDLSPMNAVWRDPATSWYGVEGGATLWNVYSQLYRQFGVTLPAGSCASVGTGGHFTWIVGQLLLVSRKAIPRRKAASVSQDGASTSTAAPPASNRRRVSRRAYVRSHRRAPMAFSFWRYPAADNVPILERRFRTEHTIRSHARTQLPCAALSWIVPGTK